MNSVAVIQSIRYLLSNDVAMRGYLSAASSVIALRQIVYSDSGYTSKEGNYLYPGIVIRMNEDTLSERIPTNNVIVNIEFVNSIKKTDAMITLIRMKDRLRDLLIDKTGNDRKFDDINEQGRALDCGDPKIRLVSWVGAVTYNDVEQGSERLHKINVVVSMVVGD